MGRPIKKKFFGNTITPYQNQARGGKTGVGGEGITALAVLNSGANSGYSTTTSVTWVASAPQITGGITATGTAVVSYTGGTGRIQTLAVSTPGTGYQTTASLTLTFTPASAGTAVTFVATTSSTRQDALAIISFIPGASQSRTNGDIIKQEGSRRYLVQNADGKGVCRLTTGTFSTPLVAGQMHIIATDAGGATYYVTKLTARKAVVYNRTNTGTAYVSSGKAVKWTIGAPTGTGASTVVSLAHTV
jgi:hypothetical protein